MSQPDEHGTPQQWSAPPPPQHGQPQHGQPSYGPQYGQPPYGQPQYGQPQYGQPPYGQPPYGQPQHGQGPVGPQSGYGLVPHAGPAGPVAAGHPGGYPAAYKDSTAAWLLWFFLGWFGGHHFYLGKTARGVVYLVVTILSFLTSFILIGFVGYLVMFVLWVVDATQLNRRLHEVNSRTFAANRAAGLA